MPGEGTMLCIDHGKKVGANPQVLGDGLDLAPVTLQLTSFTNALEKIGTNLEKIDQSIRLLRLAVNVDPPVVHVAPPRVEVHSPQVTLEPRIEVIVEKQDPPIVNVHVPQGKAPEIVVNSAVEPTPVEFHTAAQVPKLGLQEWIFCAIPCTLLICDIVSRILHP